MRKLLLMFVMLLGSVATMQAQIFDFSCATQPADLLFDNSQAPLFEEAEAIALDVDFNVGRQYIGVYPNGQYYTDVNNYSVRIDPAVGHEPGQFVLVTIDVEPNENSGSNNYIIKRSDRRDLTTERNNFADALVVAQAFVSAVTPGFTDSEEMMLSEATVAYTGANGQVTALFVLQTSGAYQVSLELGGNVVSLDIIAFNGQYRFSEDGSRISTHATAQEALDALLDYVINY